MNSTILNPVINENSTKIKSLKFGLEGDNIYKATHITTETYQSYNTTLFKRTIANNILLDNNDGEWGYIDLTRTFDIYKWRGLNFTSWLGPLIMTGFYGNPMDFVREIQYEISIYDSNNNASIDDVINRINKNKNMIKFKLGNALKAKYVPEIKFFKSDEYEYLDNINSLINKAKNE